MYASPLRTLVDTSVALSPAQAYPSVSFVTPPSYSFHPSMPSPMHSNTIPWHVPSVADTPWLDTLACSSWPSPSRRLAEFVPRLPTHTTSISLPNTPPPDSQLSSSTPLYTVDYAPLSMVIYFVHPCGLHVEAKKVLLVHFDIRRDDKCV
ncbi:hypothetical protein BDY19DRAFT_942642 [Irpex rosettiformis]|uniref:Uncharacterized protein n=1 Tax=Irpex rosettiformis TaxID=378272 RepID=A0ACB8U5F2_9APHY|nr:hypothetical protein BDY19DRAFT_942642 [Irpex rosettiformis]